MTNAELDKLAELVPPPVGCLSVCGKYVYRGDLYVFLWWNIETSDIEADVAASPDPASPAWRAAQLAWLSRRGVVCVGEFGVKMLGRGHTPGMTGSDALARLVLAVAEEERA